MLVCGLVVEEQQEEWQLIYLFLLAGKTLGSCFAADST